MRKTATRLAGLCLLCAAVGFSLGVTAMQLARESEVERIAEKLRAQALRIDAIEIRVQQMRIRGACDPPEAPDVTATD